MVDNGTYFVCLIFFFNS